MLYLKYLNLSKINGFNWTKTFFSQTVNNLEGAKY